MAFTLTGSYDGDEALVTVADDGRIDGFPRLLLDDLQDTLRDDSARPATPTGPFFPPGSPQGVYLRVLDLLDADTEVKGWGEAPPFPSHGDELDLSEPSAHESGKSTVRVRPYMREGHPVSGYTREGTDAVGAKVEHLRGDDNPFVNPNLASAPDDPKFVNAVLDEWHGFKFGEFVASVERIDSGGVGGGKWLATTVEGGIYIGEKRVGAYRRMFSEDGETVDHDNLRIDLNHRGAGFASAFYRESEALYRRLGYERVTVAAASIGAYAWARQGFQFEHKDHIGQVRGKLASIDILTHEEQRISEREAQRFAARFPTDAMLDKVDFLDELPDGYFKSPGEIATYGIDRPWTDVDGKLMWLGKWFMLYNAWGGEKWLDPES